MSAATPGHRVRPGFHNVAQLADAAGVTRAAIRTLVTQGVVTPDERGYFTNDDLRTVLSALAG